MLEAVKSICPIAIIVIILSLTIVPLDWTYILVFLIACVFLILGMSFFTMGADTAMIPVGQNIGSQLSKSNKIWLLLLCAFILGTVVTIAEPDLTIISSQVSGLNQWVYLISISVGLGVAMMIASLRIIYKINLNILLAIIYGLVFILAIFIPSSLAPLCFDSGALTTGPVSVPFILAFGVGIAAVRGNKSSQDDGFGLIALCSAVTILAAMILGCFVTVGASAGTTTDTTTTLNFGQILLQFLTELPMELKNVALILLPIIVFFLIFQIFVLKLPKQKLANIMIGFLYCFIGISIFFVGVNVGFLPIGRLIGEGLAGLSYNWILVPLCLVIGFFIILAEPAILVLAKQIEKITEGKIKATTIRLCVCLGVAASVGFCALRLLLNISFYWFLVPCYAIAIILSFVVPKIFTGISFDCGGASAGSMGSTFVLPLMIGACRVLGLDPMSMAFGATAYIALTPIITLQILGLIYKIGESRKLATEDAMAAIIGGKTIQVIDYD